jgi:hypothetical protein
MGRSTMKLLLALCLLGAGSLVFAQDAPDNPANQSPPHGWRRVDAPPPADTAQPAYPGDRDDSQNQNPDRNQAYGPSDYGIPPRLTMKAGTFVTVRVNQPLSSDHNQPGDGFSATLVRPIVVDGVIVAQRGQLIAGRVAEAQKAGRVEGVSKLAIQLTDLELVDGQQVPIQSQLIGRRGPTSVGRDAAAIGGTTALGAAIGGAADWGRGAAIGAGAGAVVGVLGVLLTRGHATVIDPEAMLTFRIEAPVTISTERAPQAFRYVDPNEYDRPNYSDQPPPRPAYACGGYGCAPPPYYYGGYWGSYYPYWGPTFVFGRGFYGGGFYGRGYYGRGYYRGFRR